MFSIKPASVHQKMYRFNEHFKSLELVLDDFYKDRLEKVRGFHRIEELIEFNKSSEVPKRIPLIIGDCLQNMRSSLDYLIWELVKANDAEPGPNNMFPICQNKRNYKKAIEASLRLKGIHQDAAAIVDALQPLNFASNKRKRHMLTVLDQLTNINKHRHVISTLVETRLTPGELPPRHFVEAKFFSPQGNGRILSYIAFEDSSVKSIEIASALDELSRYLVEQVFSRFDKFFK